MGLRPTDRNEQRLRDGELLAKFGSFFRGALLPSVRRANFRNLSLALLALLSAALFAASPPTRIVSTAPSITEMLYALGLGPNVVGDTTYCTYPADARTKPKIGTFLDPDLERILALRPDLVLVIKNPIGVTAKLRSLGLRAEELDQDSVADILSSLRQIGQLTGRDAAAARLTASRSVSALILRLEGSPRRPCATTWSPAASVPAADAARAFP